jgi:hypothetical protein
MLCFSFLIFHLINCHVFALNQLNYQLSYSKGATYSSRTLMVTYTLKFVEEPQAIAYPAGPGPGTPRTPYLD